MGYTLGTAAKATGKSKTAIWRAIDSGKISASKDVNGHFQIDPAELHRVFPPVSRNETENVDLERDVTASVTDVTAQMLALELRILKEERERERERLQNQIDDLRRRLDEEATERRSLTALLTHQPEPPAETRGKETPPIVWPWLVAAVFLVAASGVALAMLYPDLFSLSLPPR